jgi:hypothetical protein
MKRIMCLIFLLLISCAPVPVNPTPVPVSPTPAFTNPPSVPISSVFTYNQKCPHVCWLGINPGVTTIEEARTLLSSSSQIDQNSYINNAAGLRADWYLDRKQSLSNSVSVAVKNGVVQDIYIGFYTIVKIEEFIDLIGEPDEISVSKIYAAEAPRYIDYVVCYTSMNALIFVSTTNETGPDAEDSVEFLNLNIAPDDPSLPIWILELNEFRQPWLGFGHLEEYLLHAQPKLQ